MAASGQKMHLSGRKSATFTKLLYAKIGSDKVLGHLLQIWLVGTSHYTWNVGPQWPTPSKTTNFIDFARNASAKTVSEKIQLWL